MRMSLGIGDPVLNLVVLSVSFLLQRQVLGIINTEGILAHSLGGSMLCEHCVLLWVSGEVVQQGGVL